MSSASFPKITICAYTFKYRLFDAPRTAKIGRRVFGHLKDLWVAGTRRGITDLCEFCIICRHNYMCLYLQIQAFRRAKDRRNRPSRFRAFEGSLGCWYPISLICPIYVVVNCRSSRKDITYSRYGIEKIYCWAL